MRFDSLCRQVVYHYIYDIFDSDDTNTIWYLGEFEYSESRLCIKGYPSTLYLYKVEKELQELDIGYQIEKDARNGNWCIYLDTYRDKDKMDALIGLSRINGYI